MCIKPPVKTRPFRLGNLGSGSRGTGCGFPGYGKHGVWKTRSGQNVGGSSGKKGNLRGNPGGGKHGVCVKNKNNVCKQISSL